MLETMSEFLRKKRDSDSLQKVKKTTQKTSFKYQKRTILAILSRMVIKNSVLCPTK